MAKPRFQQARLLAFLMPTALILGALGTQYIGGLYPCEMCHWQRWPLYFAMVVGALSFVVKGPGVQRALVTLAGLGLLISGLIGGYHAGVELDWWEGITGCTATGKSFSLEDITSGPLIRCDVPQWSFHGITLATLNFVISTGSALIVFGLLRRK